MHRLRWASRIMRFSVCLLVSIGCSAVMSGRSLAAELQEIKQRGYFIIGVQDNFPRLGHRQSDGSLQGFEIDLAYALSEKILGNNVQLQLIPLLNRDRLPKVMNDEVDLAIANITITEARRRVVQFSQPYLSSQTALITRRPSLRTLSQVSQAPIGVLQQSIAIGRLKAAFPNASFVGLTSYGQAQQNLADGTLDSFAGDALVLRSWSVSESYRILDQGLGYSAIAIALPKGLQYESLRQSIQEALNDLEQTGWLQQKRKEWGVSIQDGAELDRVEQDS